MELLKGLAAFRARWGRPDEAEELFLECLDKRLAVLGEEHPDTLTSFHDLAELYARQGRWEEAEPLARELLDLTPEDAEEHAARKELLERIVEGLR